jgi:hypothetical protein
LQRKKITSKPAKSDYVILVEKLAGSLKMELPKGVSDIRIVATGIRRKYTLKRRK